MRDELVAELLDRPPGEVVFDLDGTLILGDLGETVAGLVDPHFPPQGYAALAAPDSAVACAVALRGQTRADINARVDEAFARDLIRINEPVAELARMLGSHHRVWILTGSPEVVGEMVAPRLGLGHVMGLTVAWDGERLSDRVVPPVPVHLGKVGLCWVRLGRRPVFAIGNSEWDFPILAHAELARTTGDIAGQRFPAFP